MQGAGCRVQGAGCRVQSAECRVLGLEREVRGSGSGCNVLGVGFKVLAVGFRIHGLGFRVYKGYKGLVVHHDNECGTELEKQWEGNGELIHLFPYCERDVVIVVCMCVLSGAFLLQ